MTYYLYPLDQHIVMWDGWDSNRNAETRVINNNQCGEEGKKNLSKIINFKELKALYKQKIKWICLESSELSAW